MKRNKPDGGLDKQKRDSEKKQKKVQRISSEAPLRSASKTPIKSQMSSTQATRTNVPAGLPQFNEKETLVCELACRWNYVLPAYPPAKYDYSGKLKSSGLKILSKNDFYK